MLQQMLVHQGGHREVDGCHHLWRHLHDSHFRSGMNKVFRHLKPDEAAAEIAGRSRGTPRIANALLRRVRDFAQVKGSGRIDLGIARYALEALNIDKHGLDEIDNKILLTIIDKFKGGPVGVGTLATAIGEDPGTVEEVYEPFLIKEGFIHRTPRGREVTDRAYTHLGRSRFGSPYGTPSLFD